MIPDLRRLLPGQNVLPFHVSPARWAFDIYDTATQAMSSNYVEMEGGRGSYTTFPFRYVWPAEVDLMAQLAGMRPREWDQHVTAGKAWVGEAGEPCTLMHAAQMSHCCRCACRQCGRCHANLDPARMRAGRGNAA